MFEFNANHSCCYGVGKQASLQILGTAVGTMELILVLKSCKDNRWNI